MSTTQVATRYPYHSSLATTTTTTTLPRLLSSLRSTATYTTNTMTGTLKKQIPSVTTSVVLSPLGTSSHRQNTTTTTATTTTTITTTKQQERTGHDLFKPWGRKRIEANGDYRQDAWLESHIGGPLYEYQKSLPRLPVPSIDDTLKRFLPTALPLCETPEQEATLKQAVADFPKQAQALQQALQERASLNGEWKDSSWLQFWWNTAGYLQVRETIVINVSYFFDFADDPSLATVPHGQANIPRAAALLMATAQFRQSVCSGQRSADKVGKKQTPLCSTAYKYLFHACRIPRLQEDTYRVYDPSLHHHVVVVRKGHFFKFVFCDPVSGHPYPVPLLEQALRTVVEKADACEAEHSDIPKLGWLTSQNRDDWAKGRQALLDHGGKAMEDALEVLESGAVLICLDDQSPVSRKETSNLYLHGNGSSSAENRWFDKSVQIIVCNNGKAGFVGEHSMMDGMPVIPLADHLAKTFYDECRANTTVASASDPLIVEPVFGPELYPSMSKAAHFVHAAQRAHADWTGQHELHCQTFCGYGSDMMKQSGFSPDAFVQMAIQIATFRLWDGHQAGTYESTQVRPFLHGRTETTRAVSTQSAALCQAMGIKPKFDETNETIRKQKLELLNQACMAHVQYIGLASQAQGVDRHFLGLSMIAGDDQPLPDLYSHPAFIKAKRWRVSTSHLTHPRFENWGYGEVVPDGVGLSYSIHPDRVVFNCTALKHHQWTDKLSQLLQESLLELRRLIEADSAAAGDAKMPKSKL